MIKLCQVTRSVLENAKTKMRNPKGYKEQKNSYRVDLDHFFEDGPKNNFFSESKELLNLTQELYHQYNRS